MRAFLQKWKPGDMVKPQCFYARLDEEWTVMEKHDRTKEMW